MLDDLISWLRIPSVSTGPAADPRALRAAAEWARRRITRAGGDAELVGSGPAPLVHGRLRAARAHGGEVPTVLLYGHYDVQDPGSPAAWSAPPFEPRLRDGRLYARGASDDKGNFLALLHAACELHAAGALAVDVRVVVEGEEESGGTSFADWLATDVEGADLAVAFDVAMVDERTPAVALGQRGLVTADVIVTTAAGPLHSGLYGGVAANAAHVLLSLLSRVVPDADGRLPAPLRAGALPPSQEETRRWALLPRGEELLADAGGRPADVQAAVDLYARAWARPSLDVHQLACGEPRTTVPARAAAHLSLRLAPGQRASAAGDALRRLLLAEPDPAGATVEVALGERTDPVLLPADAPAVVLATRALRQSCGVEPALVRSGGSIPAVSALAARGIPTLLTGFAGTDDAIHGPDESIRLDALAAAEAAARTLLTTLADITPTTTRPRSAT